MRVEQPRPMFVEAIPRELEPSVIYVSVEYNTCGHPCACGCGTEVMTPLSPAQWAMAYNGTDLSLWPSVGNWGPPCRSHYVLDRGRIRWSRSFTDAEVASNRERDRRALVRRDHLLNGDDPDTDRFDSDDVLGAETGRRPADVASRQAETARAHGSWWRQALGWLGRRS